MIVKTTEKGQLVIPARLRRELGIKPGQKLMIDREGDKLVLRPLSGSLAQSLRGVCRDEGLIEDLKKERELERERDARFSS